MRTDTEDLNMLCAPGRFRCLGCRKYELGKSLEDATAPCTTLTGKLHSNSIRCCPVPSTCILRGSSQCVGRPPVNSGRAVTLTSENCPERAGKRQGRTDNDGQEGKGSEPRQQRSKERTRLPKRRATDKEAESKKRTLVTTIVQWSHALSAAFVAQAHSGETAVKLMLASEKDCGSAVLAHKAGAAGPPELPSQRQLASIKQFCTLMPCHRFKRKGLQHVPPTEAIEAMQHSMPAVPQLRAVAAGLQRRMPQSQSKQ